MKPAIAWICTLVVTFAAWSWGSLPALADDYISVATPEAEVYIISPQAGDTVASPFTVKFGLKGMGIAPAGIDQMGTGHHHLLIDLTDLPDLQASLPATDNIKHFGGGQTETTLTLPPGEHTLQLLLANYLHIPHQPPVVSEPVTITVQ